MVEPLGWLKPVNMKPCLSRDLSRDAADPVWDKYCRAKNLQFPQTQHTYAIGDITSAYKQLEIVQTTYSDIAHEDKHMLVDATDKLIEMLSQMGMKGGMVAPTQFVINRGSSAGMYMPRGVKSKADYIDNGHVETHLPFFMKEFAADETACPLWKWTIKQEYLPRTKIDENNLRAFCFPSVAEYMVQAMYCSNFNDNMITAMDNHCSIGITFQYGGFDKLIRSMKRLPLYFKGDCSKYDKSMSADLLWQAHAIRTISYSRMTICSRERRSVSSGLNDTALH